MSIIQKTDKVINMINHLYADDYETKTPHFLVCSMLDKLPKNTWTDKYKVFLDPACGKGIFLLECFKRLMVGLEVDFPDENERLAHICANMLYGYDVSKLQHGYILRAFELISPALDEEYLNVYNVDSLKEEFDMKFDVVAMNPPYNAEQKANGKRGGGDFLWNKFIPLTLDNLLKDGGYLCSVNPAGWRKPESERSKYKGLYKKMAQDNQLEYLEIHDSVDGKKTFGAGTRYDWYIVQKTKPTKPTVVKDEKGKLHKIDLTKKQWLPNHSFDKVYDLVGDGGKIIYNVSSYETRKDWTKKEKDQTFKYPLVHATTKKGNKFWYSNRNDKGHFGISKAIFGESGINDVILDLEGKYGMTQHAMAIPVDNIKDALLLKKFLMSEKFQGILSACSWSNFQIDWRLFACFKEGFWRG